MNKFNRELNRNSNKSLKAKYAAVSEGVHCEISNSVLSTVTNLELSAATALNPEEVICYQELESQLFSVESEDLQPITSPFMVPGIYKKYPSDTMQTNNGITKAPINSNVFVAPNEGRGVIVSRRRFGELYVQTGGHAFAEGAAEHNETLEKITAPSSENNTGEWDPLSKLSHDILKHSKTDDIFIDRQRNEINRIDRVTKQKTIYRFLSPENFGLRPGDGEEVAATAKGQTGRGRPRKRALTDENKANKWKSTKKKRTPLIDREPSVKPPEESVKDGITSTLRSRYGRIVRQRLSLATRTDAAIANGVDSLDNVASILNDLKDGDYRGPKTLQSVTFTSEALPDKEQQQEQQQEQEQEQSSAVTAVTATGVDNGVATRRVPPNAICPTCHKIFLGRRLQRHFTQHPDHMLVPKKVPLATASTLTSSSVATSSSASEFTLFRFLVAKLQRSNLGEEQRADLFLNEINDLVTQLQLRSSRLIRNTSGMHFVSARCSRVLGIPEGQYSLDMSSIEADAPPLSIEADTVTPCDLNFENLSSSALRPPSANARNLEYSALSMSLDDTLTDEAAQKLNLSAGGKLLPPSEESLLRTVNDLVHDGIEKMNGTTAVGLLHPPPSLVTAPEPPVIHYDHVSDNAVEAVTMKETTAVQPAAPLLGIGVDFFQFKNN